MDAETIELAHEQYLKARRDYLTANGWTKTCTIGGRWLWARHYKGGLLMMPLAAAFEATPFLEAQSVPVNPTEPLEDVRQTAAALARLAVIAEHLDGGNIECGDVAERVGWLVDLANGLEQQDRELCAAVNEALQHMAVKIDTPLDGALFQDGAMAALPIAALWEAIVARDKRSADTLTQVQLDLAEVEQALTEGRRPVTRDPMLDGVTSTIDALVTPAQNPVDIVCRPGPLPDTDRTSSAGETWRYYRLSSRTEGPVRDQDRVVASLYRTGDGGWCASYDGGGIPCGNVGLPLTGVAERDVYDLLEIVAEVEARITDAGARIVDRAYDWSKTNMPTWTVHMLGHQQVTGQAERLADGSIRVHRDGLAPVVVYPAGLHHVVEGVEPVVKVDRW